MWINRFFNKFNQPGQNNKVSTNEEGLEFKQSVNGLGEADIKKSAKGLRDSSEFLNPPEVLNNGQGVSERTLVSDLEKVRKLQAEQGEITLENFEALTGMNPAEFIQYATGGEQINEADLEALNKTLKESLVHLAENSEGSDKSWSERIKSGLRSKTGRMVFMSLLLFLKFAPQAQAAPGELKEIDPEDNKKIEMSSKSSDRTNVFQLADDSFDGDPPFSEKLENLAKLDLTNSFETDKADIVEADRVNIQNQVADFLGKINPENFNDLMSHVWEIAGSSDERPTNNWAGKNDNLTRARIAAAEEMIKTTIDNYDFTSSGLSADQIKAIQDKEFNYNIPASPNGPERGVTYITDLENPETPGENFKTDQVESLKKSNPAEYQKLLDKCRYIKVNLLASADEKENPETSVEGLDAEDLSVEVNVKENIETWVKNFSDYDRVMIVCDNSPSMTTEKNMLADKMAESYNIETKVQVATYSDKLNRVSEESNIIEAAKHLKAVPNSGSSYEKTVDAMITGAKALAVSDADDKLEEKKLLIVLTDEAFQGVTLAKINELQKLAEEEGINVNILFSQRGEGKDRTQINITLDNLIDSFNTGAYEKLKVSQVSLEKAIIKYNNILNNPKVTDKGYIKEVKEHLNETIQKLKDLPNKRFAIKEIKLDNGEKINLPIY